MKRSDVLRWWAFGRRAALVLSAAWCSVLGIVITSSIVGAQSWARTGTPTLLAAAAMLVLPTLTALALRFDAREARRAARPHPPTSAPVTHAAHTDIPGRRLRAETPATHANHTPGRAAKPQTAAGTREPAHARR